MSWIVGEVVDFRLFDDGMVEFDKCPDSYIGETKDGVVKTEDVCVRKQTTAGEEKMKLIKSILESREFKELRNKYNKIGSSCDAVPEVTFKTKNKTIKITWCDSLTDPKSSPEFPQVLSGLFRHFVSIRQGEQSDPPLSN